MIGLFLFLILYNRYFFLKNKRVLSGRDFFFPPGFFYTLGTILEKRVYFRQTSLF